MCFFKCCPGWVRTDMAGPRATKTPDEGMKMKIQQLSFECLNLKS